MNNTLTFTPTRDRRAAVRHACVAGLSQLMASVGDRAVNAPIRDISASGISVVLEQRLEPGTLVTVELLNRTRNFWHLKLLRVVHVTPQGDGRSLVGCVFLRRITEGELEGIIGA